ncbi:MAG: anion permease [Holosporales bacterium]|nr:anion permease [Holosporales bacterium]
MIIFAIAVSAWIFVDPPNGLSAQAFHMAIIFVATMAGIMLEVCDSITLLFLGLIFLNLSSTLDIKQNFTGFSNMVPWLLFSILSLAHVLTKTTLGLRIAYLFMRHFGKNITGLSYSIILTELVIAPAMPSSTARTASVGFPLVTSLSKYISSNYHGVSEKTIGVYLLVLYSACCSICSAAYATGMISNALVLDAMSTAGLQVTWLSWIKFTIIPCLVLLLILPFVVRIVCNPKVKNLEHIKEQAAANYKQLGAMTRREKSIVVIFVAMLLMWVFSGTTGIPILVTALIGICTFLILKILDLKEILSISSTFNAVIILGLLISYVNGLISLGVIDWFSGFISQSVGSFGNVTAFLALTTIYFFAHYFFSGEGGRIVALYAPFLATGLSLGMGGEVVSMTLAVFSSMSNVLTHYTSPVSILMFSSGYITAQKWATSGLILSAVILSVWYLYICFVM